jgi:hypothetical protein
VTRALLILLVVVTLGLVLFFPGVRCVLRGHHRPERKEGTASIVCLDCPATGHDLESMGEDVALPAMRRMYERKHGTLTRSSWDEPLAREAAPGQDRKFYRGRVLPMDERFRRAQR